MEVSFIGRGSAVSVRENSNHHRRSVSVPAVFVSLITAIKESAWQVIAKYGPGRGVEPVEVVRERLGEVLLTEDFLRVVRGTPLVTHDEIVVAKVAVEGSARRLEVAVKKLAEEKLRQIQNEV